MHCLKGKSPPCRTGGCRKKRVCLCVYAQARTRLLPGSCIVSLCLGVADRNIATPACEVAGGGKVPDRAPGRPLRPCCRVVFGRSRAGRLFSHPRCGYKHPAGMSSSGLQFNSVIENVCILRAVGKIGGPYLLPKEGCCEHKPWGRKSRSNGKRTGALKPEQMHCTQGMVETKAPCLEPGM